jgi:hypothetical protein
MIIAYRDGLSSLCVFIAPASGDDTDDLLDLFFDPVRKGSAWGKSFLLSTGMTSRPADGAV